MWHASVAVIDDGLQVWQPIPTSSWVAEFLHVARTNGLALLRGVGGRPILLHAGPVALHVRRPVLPEELQACYQACPVFRDVQAKDPGGGPADTLLETIA